MNYSRSLHSLPLLPDRLQQPVGPRAEKAPPKRPAPRATRALSPPRPTSPLPPVAAPLLRSRSGSAEALERSRVGSVDALQQQQQDAMTMLDDSYLDMLEDDGECEGRGIELAHLCFRFIYQNITRNTPILLNVRLCSRHNHTVPLC